MRVIIGGLDNSWHGTVLAVVSAPTAPFTGVASVVCSDVKPVTLTAHHTMVLVNKTRAVSLPRLNAHIGAL